MSPAPAFAETRPQAIAHGWPLWQRIAFRFCVAWFVLTSVPWPLGWIPGTGWVEPLWAKAQDPVVLWTADKILDFGKVSTIFNGSGDRSYDFCLLFVQLVLSLGATAAWSILDARRTTYPRLHLGLRAYVRYGLAWSMIYYGISKVLPSQMPPPSPARLLERVGEMTPMGMLWTFIGTSRVYEAFGGAMELLGGLLLLHRRTTLLGALALLGVVGHVVLLNFCYDVPVKIYSLSLLFACFFLLVPDLPRLFDFFVRGQGTAREETSERAEPAWFRRARLAVLLLMLGSLAFKSYEAFGEVHARVVGDPDRLTVQGVFDVETFEREGKPTASDDPRAWRRVGIGSYDFGIVRANGDFERLRLAIEAGLKTFTITRRDPPHVSKLSVARDGDRLVLQGSLNDEPVKVRLKPSTTGNNLTRTRFRWINEFPDNR